jgi:hypothetical protein
VTNKKISFNPTSRRTSHALAGGAGRAANGQRSIRPGGTSFRHLQGALPLVEDSLPRAWRLMVMTVVPGRLQLCQPRQQRPGYDFSACDLRPLSLTSSSPTKNMNGPARVTPQGSVQHAPSVHYDRSGNSLGQRDRVESAVVRPLGKVQYQVGSACCLGYGF